MNLFNFYVMYLSVVRILYNNWDSLSLKGVKYQVETEVENYFFFNMLLIRITDTISDTTMF